VKAGEVVNFLLEAMALRAGYLNAPEVTAERFLPDPFVSALQARMYALGDFARWREDGSVEFLAAKMANQDSGTSF